MSGRECVINLWENPSARGGSDAEEMPSIVPSATEVQDARELLRKYLRRTPDDDRPIPDLYDSQCKYEALNNPTRPRARVGWIGRGGSA
jgi:hypothetical protein